MAQPDIQQVPGRLGGPAAPVSSLQSELELQLLIQPRTELQLVCFTSLVRWNNLPVMTSHVLSVSPSHFLDVCSEDFHIQKRVGDILCLSAQYNIVLHYSIVSLVWVGAASIFSIIT